MSRGRTSRKRIASYLSKHIEAKLPPETTLVILLVLAIAPSFLGWEDLGVILSWLLIGFLVFKYSLRLFPTQLREFVSPRGARGLLAAWTVVMGGLIELFVFRDQGSAAFSSDFVAGLLIVLLAGVAVFTAYFRVAVNPDVVEERLLRWVAIQLRKDPKAELREFAAYSKIGAWFVRGVIKFYFALMIVFACTAAALFGAGLHFLYPLPETVLMTGFVAHKALHRFRKTSWAPSRHGIELDFRLLDTISAATRNSKGFFLFLYCALGLVLAAVWWAVGASVIISTVGFAAALLFHPVDPWLDASGPLLVARILVVVAVVSWSTALLFFGAYGVYFWLGQLERLESYAIFWARNKRLADEPLPDSLAPRVPGLLAPFHLFFLVSAVFFILIPRLDHNPYLLLAVFVICVLFIVGLSGVAIWTIRWKRKSRIAQSIQGDSQVIVSTFLLQYYSMMFFVASFLVVAAGLPLTPPFSWEILFGTSLLGLVLPILTYFPETVYGIERAQSHKEYLRAFALWESQIIIISFLLLLAIYLNTGNISLPVLVVFLLLMLIPAFWSVVTFQYRSRKYS